MNNSAYRPTVKGLWLLLSILGGVFLLMALLLAVNNAPLAVRADPIDPPEGYPKLGLSVKTVTPTLAATGGVTLTYRIEIQNTGAYTAAGATLSDVFPDDATYNGDAWASVPTVTVTSDTLAWTGDVGFDSTVVVTFSVTTDAAFSGTLRNTAVISHPLIARPVTVTVETVVTDDPILTIAKTSLPAKPGAAKPLVYTLVVVNQGQPTPPGTPITVTDRVPLSTTLLELGVGGVSGTVGSDTVVTWTRQVTLELGDTVEFTFSVEVGDVPSGTVIANEFYNVAGPEAGVAFGEPYTVTIVDPIFLLSKQVWPDPPGSNREMTYTLTLLNVGSLATGLTITDRVPGTVSYTRGGAYSSGVVSWSLPRLNTGKSAEFTYTVYISDVMGIAIVNDDYAARCAEGVRQPGDVLTSVVFGPTFEAFVTLDPIAKKPGGGGGPVTPTLVVHNTGPGNAIDATAVLEFGNISVSQGGDLRTIPPSTWPFPRATCLGDEYDKCYSWIGDLMYGETITFTTYDPQSTSGGEEGTTVTATVVITDGLSNVDTTPVTGTGIAKVTHLAYLNVHKSAPKVIGRGQVMTYTINIWNSALATDPPNPYLWDFMPISGTTVITSSISHGGTIQSVLTGSLQATVISWTLPALGTGERIEPRSFAVRVDGDLVSGTQIINDYRVGWYENDPTYVGWRENDGQPFTTTVVEVGLIDSFKVVTPELALPGPGNVLTYYLHIVNSSPLSLTGVTVYDYLPWQSSTYYRDAVASAGQVVSDIISVRWTGDVDAFSSEVVTLTVLVDADYKGPVTNTAVISHPGLLDDVVVEAVAYITDEPVLAISKRASPSPVSRGGELLYTIRVRNLGQQATSLVITDAVPANTTYITGSATSGGQLVGDVVRWENIHVIDPGGSRSFGFRVAVERGSEIVNDRYVVRCQEGVIDVGDPVITRVMGGGNRIYLPLIVRNL